MYLSIRISFIAETVDDGRYWIDLKPSSRAIEWRGIVISHVTQQMTIGLSDLDEDLPRLENGDIPLSDVVLCLPQGCKFRRPLVVRMLLYRRAEGPLTIWYTATDVERTKRWHSVGELTTGKRRVVFNDGLDAIRNEAELLHDDSGVVLYLRHSCSLVITEQKICWHEATLQVFLLYIADSDDDKSVVNIVCNVFINSGDCRNRVSDSVCYVDLSIVLLLFCRTDLI